MDLLALIVDCFVSFGNIISEETVTIRMWFTSSFGKGSSHVSYSDVRGSISAQGDFHSTFSTGMLHCASWLTMANKACSEKIVAIENSSLDGIQCRA
jgi:hypothetical protein